MAATTCYTARSATQSSIVGTLCLRYVNWLARRDDHRFLEMSARVEDIPQPPNPASLELRTLAEAGGLRKLLRLFNTAYVGASDFRKAGRIQEMALKACKGFDPSMIWIAYADGEEVGFCMARCSHGAGRITGIGVNPAWRNRGIGKSLLFQAASRLREKGASSVTISVDRANQKCVGIYERMGFSAI